MMIIIPERVSLLNNKHLKHNNLSNNLKSMGPQKLPEVVLPCDLPTWSMVQEYLVVLQSGVTSEEMIVAMLRIYDICNVSPNASEYEDSEITSLDDHMFDDFKQVIEAGFSSRERERFLSRTLPCMARYLILFILFWS